MAYTPIALGNEQPLPTSLRQRDWRGYALPAVMAAPLTTATSAANAASSITSAVRVRPDDASAVTIHGARMVFGPAIAGSTPAVFPYGAATGGIQSPSPYVVEFTLDTVLGVFEIIGKDSAGNNCRVAVDGQYITNLQTFANSGSTGGTINWSVTASAGVHAVRIEFPANASFGGLNIGPTDSIKAAPKPPLLGYVVGDSFTEPTMMDSTTGAFGWGWMQNLSQITGLEIRSSGSGGTGYLNPGVSSRVKFRDRLAADVLSQSPDFIIWAGGINDQSYTPAQVTAEATLCYQAVSAALPNCVQIVLSPFTNHGALNLIGTEWATRDAIAAAAAAVQGVIFADLNSPADEFGYGAVTLATSAAATNNAISVSAVPPAISTQGAYGSFVRIGAGATSEVQMVTGLSGTGPYTLNLNAGLTNAHASGEAVQQVGRGVLTGTGHQGATTGSGTADRMVGTDGTHPTQAGHRETARAAARFIQQALANH